MRAIVWPVERGVLTVQTRPDLSGETPKTDDYAPPVNRFAAITFEFSGQLRQFYALPSPGDRPLPPLVILLHGSGRDGRSMLDMWQAIAAQGVFLVAPDALNRDQWSPSTDGPEFFAELLDQAAKIQPFDRDRVFLYGHSAGAGMALYLGDCTEMPVRAIAVHAGALNDCFSFSRPAVRRYLIQVGDSDLSFPLQTVQASADRIIKSGSPVTLQIIPGHDHWFYDIGPELAKEAWQFLLTAP